MAFLLSVGAVAAPPPESLEKLIGPFKGARSGVDRSGNLWVWDSEENRVTRVSPGGIRRFVDLVGDERAIDADAVRGVVALRDHGSAIRIFDWDGRVVSEFGLGNSASNVSWLDGDELAVAPLFTADLIEVWNARSRRKVAAWVRVPPVLPPARGAVFARATLLRYDARRAELVAVDSIDGGVRVVAAGGRVARTGNFPRAEELRPWLRQLDESARTRGESQTPLMWHYATVTIADDGAIWVADGSDDKTVRALRLSRAGKVERHTFDSTCPTRRFEAWQGHFIFYQHPKSPQPACVGVRRQ